MPKLVILGSSAAVPDANHENTHLALLSGQKILLVDCVSNPIARLGQAGLDLNKITNLILTHFHPDHVSGVPLLLMDMWLLGRQEPLHIHGLEHTLERVKALMDLYNWKFWPEFYPVKFYTLPEDSPSSVIESEEWRVLSYPVCHLIPTIGLRFELLGAGAVLAYSSDTEPCAADIALAHRADVLIHEATGASAGHSSAAQAGEVAQEANAGRLYLIHYPTGDFDARSLLAEASETFDGPVALAQDFMEINF